MSSRKCLRFLRPYLYESVPANKAVYTRFFAAYHSLGQSHSSCGAVRSVALHSKNLHTSARKSAGTPSRASDDDESLSLSARADVVDARIQKLKQYNSLRYPRLESRENRMSIPEFREKYRDEGSTPAGDEVVLEGRVMSVRRVGSKLVFFHVMSGYQQVQIMVDLAALSSPQPTAQEFKDSLHPFQRGDIVSVTGKAVRTKKGELTLSATEIPKILSPSLAHLPQRLTNEETLVLNRHVDLLINRRASDILRVRSHIIRSLRDFFHAKDFLEVQTPILADYAGGAIARPFLTSATEFPHKELTLRIAPELWLKRLVVGGNDKVFEIGPAFRNEGLDTTHNPEFTICEFYSAYTNLPGLMSITENLITHIIQSVDSLIQTQLASLQRPATALLEGQWKRVEFIPALEEILGFKFPDLSDSGALDKLIGLLHGRENFNIVPGVTLNKLLDQLAGTYLEPFSLENPLFIMNHPACMSPLSKSFTCPKTGQLVSARAELFIQEREIANMYEEENDPFEQRRKFELQIKARGDGTVTDEEIPSRIDESYIGALEHGLPPTGGWGCGIDRLVMLLSGAPRIADTLSFGSLRNVVSLSQVAQDA
ncbi:lysyl-tRNA synthetase-like protein [Biscogniauxia mediterranea]|nr:lysyl-tRNA synthetase-like protein [Biscogniauxia mediterranea]